METQKSSKFRNVWVFFKSPIVIEISIKRTHYSSISLNCLNSILMVWLWKHPENGYTLKSYITHIHSLCIYPHPALPPKSGNSFPRCCNVYFLFYWRRGEGGYSFSNIASEKSPNIIRLWGNSKLFGLKNSQHYRSSSILKQKFQFLVLLADFKHLLLKIKSSIVLKVSFTLTKTKCCPDCKVLCYLLLKWNTNILIYFT